MENNVYWNEFESLFESYLESGDYTHAEELLDDATVFVQRLAEIIHKELGEE